MFNYVPGQVACVACAPGQISINEGSLNCTKCNVGSIQKENVCNSCEPGKLQAIVGEKNLFYCLLFNYWRQRRQLNLVTIASFLRYAF